MCNALLKFTSASFDIKRDKFLANCEWTQNNQKIYIQYENSEYFVVKWFDNDIVYYVISVTDVKNLVILFANFLHTMVSCQENSDIAKKIV